MFRLLCPVRWLKPVDCAALISQIQNRVPRIKNIGLDQLSLSEHNIRKSVVLRSFSQSHFEASLAASPRQSSKFTRVPVSSPTNTTQHVTMENHDATWEIGGSKLLAVYNASRNSEEGEEGEEGELSIMRGVSV